MSVEVRFYPSQIPCDNCKIAASSFVIRPEPLPSHGIFLCPCCLGKLSRKINPLSILVTTGQDIKP